MVGNATLSPGVTKAKMRLDTETAALLDSHCLNAQQTSSC